MLRFFIIAVFCWTSTRVFAQVPADSLTLYLFLLEDCKITQAYTDRLHDIYDRYNPQGIRFVGLFSNPISNDTTVAAFTAKYGIPFPCRIDDRAEKARALGVTVTPEVVLYDERNHAILYQGRIDNLYERVGQRRQVVTSFELEAALYAVTSGRPVPIPRTQAVGCYLPISKP
ncbi:MAG: hypothetical protein SFV52_15490 [Saprospiraceae bacterium]|nr:hypothetical protein [Saprospiraceae bacterium]